MKTAVVELRCPKGHTRRIAVDHPEPRVVCDSCTHVWDIRGSVRSALDSPGGVSEYADVVAGAPAPRRPSTRSGARAGYSPAETSIQSWISLLVGAAGLPLLGLPGPIAWWLANREIRAIREGDAPIEALGVARLARALGIAGTVLAAVFAIGFGVLYVTADVPTRPDGGNAAPRNEHAAAPGSPVGALTGGSGRAASTIARPAWPAAAIRPSSGR